MRQLFTGYECNNGCVFCAQGELRRSSAAPTDALVRGQIEALAKAPGFEGEAAFVGGEPTLREELSSWVVAAKAGGCRWILVQTNGRRLAYPSYSGALAAAGADAVEVALAGSSAPMHEYHTGSPGSFQQSLLGIRQARAHGLAVGVGIVVTRSNFRHLPEIVRLAAAQGAQAVSLTPALPLGRAGRDWLRVVPEAAMIAPFAAEAEALAAASGLRADPRLFAGLGPVDESARVVMEKDLAVRASAGSRPAPALNEVHVSEKKTGENLREISPISSPGGTMANIGYMQVVRHCNQYCRFCSNPETEYMLDPETAKRQIDDFKKRGYFGVILTGGEPSLSPHIPEITRYAVSQGLHARMITNGSRIAEWPILKEFVDAGLKHYHVSIHSHRADVEDFLTGVKGSHDKAMQALENLGRIQSLGVSVNINTVINAYNSDHLDENVRFFCERFPFIDHFVWNNLDPSMGRAETNRDTAPRLRQLEVSLNAAMRYLDGSGRTFRVERVPLCFMAEFAHCSTETRKIVKGEERMVHFLDEKGTIRQTDFEHLKADVCASCSLNDICGGLFDLGKWYDPGEFAPVFVPKEPIVAKIWASGD